jgi:hypothetical protein
MNLNKITNHLLVLGCCFAISCNSNSQEKLMQTSIKNIDSSSNDKLIDSIYIDLNNDNKIDRVKIIENLNSSRVVIVEINSDNGFKIISSNNEIIGCSSCGYQSGDPFVDLDKKTNGFILYLENSQVTFFYESDSIYLKEVDLLKTNQTENGIEESHEKYSFKDFGKLNLSELKAGFEFELKNNECISTNPEIKLPFTSDYLKKYTKPYQLADCIDGNIKDFYCGEDKLRYISLLSVDSLNIILVPMDCGDFNLFQLLVLKNNRLISNLEVDGKWYEIGEEDNYKVTKFTLNKDSKLNVVIEQYQNNKLSSSNSQNYLINAQGLILKE